MRLILLGLFTASLTIFFGILEVSAHQGSDPILKSCSSIHPIRLVDNLFFVDLQVHGKNGSPSQMKFLLDTGFSESAILLNSCRKVGCKIIGEKKLDSQNPILVKRTDELTLTMGQKEFKSGMNIEDSPAISLLNVDGVIGGDVLLKTPIILNLKEKYLCYPSKPLYEIDQELKLERIPVVYDAGRIWLSFLANGLKLDDYFLDTGSDSTSILSKDLMSLKLRQIDEDSRATSESGNTLYTTKTYGPASIQIGKWQTSLNTVTGAKDERFRKLGSDVLRSSILGIDSNTKFLFVGH